MAKTKEEKLQLHKDLLKTEGVRYKGYGIIPKALATDPSISLTAKSIYSYIASFAGGGSVAFPGRDLILSDLQICKSAYYNAYNELIESGYIIVNQALSSGKFSHNEYVLVQKPSKYMNEEAPEGREELYRQVRLHGIDSAGYGFIPKAVMQDPRISVKAKGLYELYASFSGAGTSSHPKKENVLYYLGISSPTYQKLNKELIAANLITAVKSTNGGKFNGFEYIINTNPGEILSMEKKKSPETKKQDTVKASPQIKKQDTIKRDTEKRDTLKQDTNNNKNNINSINNNNLQQQSAQNQNLSVEERLMKEGTIPADYLSDKSSMIKALKLMSDFERKSNIKNYSRFKDGALQYSMYMLYMEALTHMLTNKTGVTVKGQKVYPEEILNKLLIYVKPLSAGMPYIDLVESLSVERYLNACKNNRIRNTQSYMVSCIWETLKVGVIESEAQILFDAE